LVVSVLRVSIYPEGESNRKQKKISTKSSILAEKLFFSITLQYFEWIDILDCKKTIFTGANPIKHF
jgi:hypothetical protein